MTMAVSSKHIIFGLALALAPEIDPGSIVMQFDRSNCPATDRPPCGSWHRVL
jgi:hypothetical protein